MFSKVVEFLKILGAIFGQENTQFHSIFSFGGSWPDMNYVALHIWPLMRVPITVTRLCVTHWEETDLGKQKSWFSVAVYLESEGQRLCGRKARRREGGRRERYIWHQLSWIIESQKSRVHLIQPPFPYGSTFPAPLTEWFKYLHY